MKRVLIFWDPKSNALTAGQNAPATYVHLLSSPAIDFSPAPKRGAAHLRAGRCRPPLPSPVTRCATLAQVQEEHKIDVVRQDVEVQAGVGG